MAIYENFLDSIEKVCPVCGKTFIVPPQNVYKITVKDRKYDCCSYSCIRKHEKQQEGKRKYNRVVK